MLISRRGTTGIMFCCQTGFPITAWAYKREGLLSYNWDFTVTQDPGFRGRSFVDGI